jgi:hypothetical protein
MKTAIATMMLFIGMINVSAINTNEVKLEGYFLNASKVTYEVYTESSTGWDLVKSKSSTFSYFKEKLNINQNYLIVFRKDSKVKFLYLEARRTMCFTIDVDFNTTDNARITYEKNKYKYDIIGENKSCFL